MTLLKSAGDDVAPRVRRLDRRIAIVTGSDSGIGKAIAEAFALEGADVAIAYHSDRGGAEATAREVERIGQRRLVRQLDVTDERSVAAFFETVVRELGRPDILVNSAGMGSHEAPVAEIATEDFDRVIKTDLYGPFFCCREFMRLHRTGGGGKIVNVTSVHEAIPSPRNAPYGAAKGGLLAFTRSLALEAAALRINVNAVAPGLVRTPMTNQRTDDPTRRARELPNIPWRRPGQPWEIARLALYLASDDADYVTGQSFTIDGGLEMNWGQGA